MAFAPFPITFNIYFYSWRTRWQAAILAGNIVNKIKGKLFSSCGNWVMMYVFLSFGNVLVMQGNINISLRKTIREFLKFSSFKRKNKHQFRFCVICICDRSTRGKIMMLYIHWSLNKEVSRFSLRFNSSQVELFQRLPTGKPRDWK